MAFHQFECSARGRQLFSMQERIDKWLTEQKKDPKFQINATMTVTLSYDGVDTILTTFFYDCTPATITRPVAAPSQEVS